MFRFVIGMLLFTSTCTTPLRASDAIPKKENDAAKNGDAEALYLHAVALASGGDAQVVLSALESSLSAGSCPTRALTEKAFLTLHENPAFRGLIRRFAKQSETSLVVGEEPGTPMRVRGRITDSEGKAISDARIYVFQTGNSGSYSSAGGNAADMGDSLNPRIFGYLRSGADGSYAFRTIRPGQYPGEGPPAHIHYEVRLQGFEPAITELMFTDDSRMNEETKKWAKSAGFGLCEPSQKAGEQECNFDIVLNKRQT